MSSDGEAFLAIREKTRFSMKCKADCSRVSGLGKGTRAAVVGVDTRADLPRFTVNEWLIRAMTDQVSGILCRFDYRSVGRRQCERASALKSAKSQREMVSRNGEEVGFGPPVWILVNACMSWAVCGLWFGGEAPNVLGGPHFMAWQVRDLAKLPGNPLGKR